MKTLLLFSTLVIIVHACDHHHHHHHGKHDTQHGSAQATEEDPLLHPVAQHNGTLTSQQRRALAMKSRSGPPGGGRCGTLSPTKDQLLQSMQVVANWEAANGGSGGGGGEGIANGGAAATTTKYVKVWWHVMKGAKTGKLKGAWSKALANEAMDYLNYYYYNTSFYFYLDGMTQNVNKKWWNCPDDNYATEYLFKTSLRREGADTLNVYMCNLLVSQDHWGYSSFPDEVVDWPEYDGVTIANPWPTGDTKLDVFMTLVHEVGHWMGLYHTFEGGCNSTSGGDAVTDTPAHSGPSWDEDGADTCFVGMELDTCPNNVFGVDPGLDPVNNHMNYIDTVCESESGEFTSGQMTRMEAMFDEWRYLQSTCRYEGVRCMQSAQCCSNQCQFKECL